MIPLLENKLLLLLAAVGFIVMAVCAIYATGMIIKILRDKKKHHNPNNHGLRTIKVRH